MADPIWNGNEALRPMLRAIKSLQPHSRNPRIGDVDLIARSLERFGQQRPVLILKDGTLLAGHHVYQAAKKLGWTHVAAVKSDLEGGEVEPYLIADNRTSDLGKYDDGALLETLEGQRELAGTGYSEEDKVLLRAIAKADDAQAPAAAELYRMILRYDRETYERMIARLDELLEAHGVESYSEAIAVELA